jgi:hypothetical protein
VSGARNQRRSKRFGLALFIRTTGGDVATAGQVPRCSPKTMQCHVIVPANGMQHSPQFLIFGKVTREASLQRPPRLVS